MNTYELLEAAQLDALGLLDDAERDAFDAAFFAASPDVQAQIRREQARLVRTDWLPSSEVEPSAGLKDAARTIPFRDLPTVFNDFIEAKVTGRIVVDLNA